MDAILEILPGQGDMEVVKRVRRRRCCDECGEDAVYRHSYLLDGSRRNPASSAYGKDDCSWCSDEDRYTCKDCKRPSIDGYGWCATFPATGRFAHMFLEWHEVETSKVPAETASGVNP